MEVRRGTIHILPRQEVYTMATFRLLRDDNTTGSRGGLFFFYVDAAGVGGGWWRNIPPHSQQRRAGGRRGGGGTTYGIALGAFSFALIAKFLVFTDCKQIYKFFWICSTL